MQLCRVCAIHCNDYVLGSNLLDLYINLSLTFFWTTHLTNVEQWKAIDLGSEAYVFGITFTFSPEV